MNKLITYQNVPIFLKRHINDIIFQKPLYGILESFDYMFELLLKDIGLELADVIFTNDSGTANLYILDTNAGKKIYNVIQENKYGAVIFKCFELENNKLLISSFNLVLAKTKKEILNKMPNPDKRKIFKLKG